MNNSLTHPLSGDFTMQSDPSMIQTGLPDGCGTSTGNVTIASVGGTRPSTNLLAQRARAMWTSGDFARIAVGFTAGAEAFVQRLDLLPGETVLDAACGTGNLALPAARAGAVVTGLDIAPNLLETARALSTTRGLGIQFHEGDVECMPFHDRRFATVISMFGVMFAPRPERALSEVFRVTQPGGRIALANWTPNGFIGELLRAHTDLVPPPPGVPSVLGWGDADVLRDRLRPFDSRIQAVRFTRRTIELAYPLSPRGVTELFREFYGPSVRAFASLDAERRGTLSSEMLQLWTNHNRARGNRTLVNAEYLDVRIDLE